MAFRPGRTGTSETRGQAEVAGFVVLIAIAVIGVTSLVLLGGGELAEFQQSADLGQARSVLETLDAQGSLVALGHDDENAQRIDGGPIGREGRLRTTQTSWMRVGFINASTGVTETKIVNQSLGTVVYVSEESSIGYEGGGVWRSDRDEAIMLSPPEFAYRETTLTLPIIAVKGDSSLSNTLVVRRKETPEQKFPNRTANLTNTLDSTKVRVTVHSRYYEAWGRYFRESTNGYVSVDHAAETATVTFPAPNAGPSVFPSGIVATAGSGYLRFGGNGAYSDSYNSSEGSYTDTWGRNGTVVAAGDVKTTGNSTVYGDIWSGDTADLDGETDVYGTIYWTETFERDGAAVSGDNVSIPGVASIEPIDWYVSDRVAGIKSNNDNAETTVIEDKTLNISDGGKADLPTGTLGPGRYYLKNLTLHGERLVLNTTEGNVTVAVRDYALLKRGGQGDPGSNITVSGDGVARIYVAARDKKLIEKSGQNNLDRDRNLNLYVSLDSEVHIPKNRSPRLRVFGPRSFTMAIAGSESKPTFFNGYIYAPAGLYGDGYIYAKHADIYGGAVTGNLTIGQSGAIHYDETLSRRAIPESPGLSRIEYLYTSVYEINVSSP